MKNDEVVLFITEKWVDGLPYKGLTNNYHNLFGTFKKTHPTAKLNVLHLDEIVVTHNSHIDNVILAAVNKIKPTVCIFSLLGKSNVNPSEYTYNILKNKNIKMVFMWPDVGIDWGKPEIEIYLKKYADLHVCWGSEGNIDIREKIEWMWAPQDENLYFPLSEAERFIPVSFLGSTRYEERQRYLSYLRKNNVNIEIRGGQREESLTPKQYAELIRSSKISLNFPYCPSGFDQCKGRVWEILASNSMLLERKNSATSKMLTPGVHYVEYINEKDLKEKIEYYLNHPEERIKIADAGFAEYMNRYTSIHFWNAVFNRLEQK